jgi:hypothetical protein
MLRGRCSAETGRPILTGYVTIPSLGVSGAVRFLMDTGADKTAIMLSMPSGSESLAGDYFPRPTLQGSREDARVAIYWIAGA